MSVSATKSERSRGHRAGSSTSATSSAPLLGIYGLIILLVGIFGDAEEDKTGGVNANLWAGLVLLVVGCDLPRPGRGCDRSSSPTTSRPTTTRGPARRALAPAVFAS